MRDYYSGATPYRERLRAARVFVLWPFRRSRYWKDQPRRVRLAGCLRGVADVRLVEPADAAGGAAGPEMLKPLGDGQMPKVVNKLSGGGVSAQRIEPGKGPLTAPFPWY